MEASLHAIVLLTAPPALSIAVSIRHAETPTVRCVVYTTLATLLGLCCNGILTRIYRRR